MRQKRQMDKLRFLTESRNGKESVIEKLIHKDNSSPNRISCSIAEKSDIKSVMDICFARQQWMTEQGFNYVLNKDNRKYYRHKIEDRKLWVCKHSGVVMGFCVVEDHDINGYWKDFPTDSFVYAHDGMTRPHKSVKETSDYNFIGILINAIIDFYGKGIRFDVLLPNQRLESFYEKELGCNPVKKVIDEDDGSCHLLMEKTNNNPSLTESFTKKISSKKNTDLISKPSFVLDNGVYIFHETLGVRTVDGWNPKNNDGVVGVLVVEDDHKIVVATEDSPEDLPWSNEYELINQPVDDFEDAKSDFNGEMYCRRLDSPDFPAAYYCKTYNKGNRDWYLPSSGELWLICRHLEEIQNALSIVGGQKFVTSWDEGDPVYWSSTEGSDEDAWALCLSNGHLNGWYGKVNNNLKVRPVSKFDFSTLKESFTRKISSKKNDELTAKADTAFVPDGVYILHETLGVRTVDSWNPKNNDGVVGILLIEDDHKIVVATKDAPEYLCWSKKDELVNEPIESWKEAESDFNGEIYCKRLDSPDFPAAYYCKTYNKGGRNWYLPSTGELWLIYNHLEEIQNALSIVGGQKLITTWDEGDPVYWSSTEVSATDAWSLYLNSGSLYWDGKVSDINKVRPVSKFQPSELKESFTRKIRSKKNDELTTKSDTAFVPDGVYILHETLGVKTVDGWNPKNNNGVVGILLVEDDHKIVVATEDAPKKLRWSKFRALKQINEPIKKKEDAESDFNGEEHCIKLNSPDFPAAYYCLNYKKGGRNWYLPSTGELWLIYNHLEEIQNALETVGGKKFVTSWDDNLPWYWSSTEESDVYAWLLNLSNGNLYGWNGKAGNSIEVRPVSKFDFSTLKESFTRKIRSKKNDELISKPAFEIPDGVYILHETLGVCGVDNWDSENNDGVEGILVKDNDTKLIVSVDEFTEIWARKLQSKFNVNKTFIYRDSLNASDKKKYTGKILCQKLNSPDFPAAYRCLCYHKGNINNWYLPSIQELHTIAEHRHEIQEALIKVNGDILKFSGENVIILKSRSGQGGNWYWSSTESHREEAWSYNFDTNINSGWTKKSENSFQVRPVAYFGEDSGLEESFTRKISRKKNDELISKADTAFVPDGVYILHETLGVRTVDSWNPEDNEGVVGILLIEDNHRIVVALEDSPKDLLWSKERKLVNKPVEGSFIDSEEAESDFNGEYYCQNLNSPDFPAAYYCLNYKKGGRNWYLPSSGELLMIYNHFEEIQNALSIVGGQKFITKNDDFGLPAYWSSTEGNSTHAWFLSLEMRCLDGWFKDYFLKVRPVSKFSSLKTLKESFTRKISRKKNDEMISKADTAFVPDGVYILHETLGVKTVDGWNPKDNDGVVGILLIEDEHQIVIALEVSPKNLIWSEEYNFVNRPIKNSKTAKSKFNGEKYCRNLNSPDFPAAYYCLNYNKGGRDWYLPSMGELWLIYRHLEEIQTASSTVGGQRSVFTWDEFAPCFWSSTERDVWSAWVLNFGFRGIPYVWYDKVGKSFNVLPISKFQPSELKESFTKKISSKKNTDLISKPSFVPDDGVYILHETLGVRGVEGWNPKDNDGVVGILVVEDEHQLVVALEDSPKNLIWSKERKLVNRPIEDDKDAESDFNGEEYCRNLNSPDFPAAYYCLNYKKGGLDWYLPSAGELWLIYQHIEEVQNALSIVGGQRFDTGWDKCNKTPCYWSSTEHSAIFYAWGLYLHFGGIDWDYKASDSLKVRPFSKFQPSELKESFTKKISSKKNSDLISKPSFVPDDGVYIFHKTLGLKTIDEWDRKDNLGVVGILVVQDEHQIVISLTDFLQTFHWSKEKGLVNKPIYDKSNAWSDFNGEEYCKKLNSKDFPAAYFCINYGNYRGVWSFDSLSAEEMAIKADYNWYLPSAGEMGIIYKNLNDVQLALRMVGGYSIREEFYLSSSEVDASNIWKFNMYLGELSPRCVKTIDFGWVRPVFKFNSNFLKESFTKKIKKTSNKDLVDTADKLAITNYDYNEENFKNKLRKETELYYKSEFYKVYNYPLDYRYNGDVWPANEDGFHNMYLESTYYTERNEEVNFEGYFNDDTNKCAEPADVGILVFGYGKDCVAYGEYEEYAKTHRLIESFTAKTKNINNKDLQNKSDNIFNLDNLLREYVKSHCRPGSHNYDFYFSEENRPVFSDKEWKKLQGITVVKEIDDYYPSLHVVTPHGSTISNDFLPNVDDVFLFYIYRRRKFHIPVNRLPEKLLQELMEWILNINESFTRKTKQKSTEDLRQKADEHIGFKNLVKEIVLENDSFKENDQMLRIFRNRQPRCTHALNKLRVRPTSDPTLSPYAIQGMVVLDESFYFKPEKYNISSLLAKDLTRKAMKDLYNSDSIIVLDRIYTMEYRGKEFLRTEFNILRYNERYGRYSDEMNPQDVYFEFADLPKELQSDIYSFLRKRFNKK